MSTGTQYNELKNLTFWIDNQKAFERHKKKLDEIYMTLHKRSADEFGKNHKTFELMQTKIRSLYEQHKFNEKEKSLMINKVNQNIGGNLKNIQNRKNVLISNSIDFNERNQILKKRIDLIKNIENKKIRRENELMGKRINEKKYNEEYQKTLYYKNFNKKFELPKIKQTGPKVVKRKLDISPYNRAIRIGSLNSSGSFDKSIDEADGVLTPQIRRIKKNFSQENISSKEYQNFEY